MIDKKHIGQILAPHTVEVETGRLRFFAKATGDTNPLYSMDENSCARLPVPLTFLFCLDMERADPFEKLTSIGMDLSKVLHGEQSFEYVTPAYSGDRLTFATRVVDIYDKRAGAMEFVLFETRVTNQLNQHVANLNNVIIQRNA